MTLLNRAATAMLVVVTALSLALVLVPPTLAAFGVVFPSAWAAPDGQVVVPYGDWLSASLTTLQALPIGEVVFGWLIAVLIKLGLPQQIVAMIRTMVTEQMLQKSIDYAINAVSGAAKGRKLEVRVANQVLEQAIEYVVDNAPGWLVGWLDGPDGIRRRILARLDLVPEARVAAGGEVVGTA